MGVYDFDKVINRRGTSCLKYDFAMKRTGRDDLLPLWVADMDFALPEEILEVLEERIRHGIFGYTDPDDAYYDALENWFLRRYNWKIDRSWNTVTPGVVYALATAVKAYTAPGDAILIQQPVYYPFKEVIEDNGRRFVNNQLVFRDGRYEMDLEDFERKIVEENVKLYLLCSPHNPVGRVWSAEELKQVADVCIAHNVTMIVDEIHCDFILPGTTYTAFGTLGETYASHAVICTSASKTFNIAGLQTANILIPDPELRAKFKKANAAAGYSQGNVMGLVGTRTVYERGEAWLEALLDYLNSNLIYVRDYLEKNIPEVRLIEPEGTYLIWIDFAGAVETYEELHHLIREEAKLWLDDGIIFGPETALFERINIACPKETLTKALDALAEAVERHRV